ncbi:MAG: ribbon-helix-helix domain-containing protein [archaeon]
MAKRHISIRLDPPDYSELRRLATKEHRSISSFIRHKVLKTIQKKDQKEQEKEQIVTVKVYDEPKKPIQTIELPIKNSRKDQEDTEIVTVKVWDEPKKPTQIIKLPTEDSLTSSEEHK